MGWDWDTYHKQPINFLKIIDIMRQSEVEESIRQEKWHQQQNSN